MIEVELGDGLEISVDDGQTVREIVVDSGIVVELAEVGPQGPKGEPGEGSLGSSGSNLVVSEADPGLTEPGLWIQTGIGDEGNDITFWVEDGA